ncbi:MAG: hypothetical protein DRQ88_13010 [Epsilonproteobacteria bacterium]|nr:MAG: hypothetical protein DRQ88_13010 [Campylobacterota bacterium]
MDVEFDKEQMKGELEVNAEATLKEEKFGWCQVDHGKNQDGDYVWNFFPWHRSRPFPDKMKTLLSIIHTYLDKVIPEDIKVEVTQPPADWEIKLITVEAKGLANKWNFDEENMSKYLPTIGDMISHEVDLWQKESKVV